MPIRTAPALERNVVNLPMQPVVLAAGQVQDVLPDVRATTQDEVVYREVCNVGNANAYFALGRTADPQGNYNGILVPYQAYSVGSLERVSVYSPAGTTIALTILVRKNDQ